MSSSNNREQSLSDFHHRSLNRRRHLESTSTEATWNGLSSDVQQATSETAQMMNRLQQLKVNSDVNKASAHGTTIGVSTHIPCQHSESLIEEELIERLKELINEFMTRPGRRYSYKTTMRWTIDHGNEINYSVVILISQPSDLI
jgi:hypothetical protein